MTTRQKEALTAAAIGGVAGYALPEVLKPQGKQVDPAGRWLASLLGAAAGAVLVYTHSAPRYLDGLGRLR